jgi:hypothetical protein
VFARVLGYPRGFLVFSGYQQISVLIFLGTKSPFVRKAFDVTDRRRLPKRQTRFEAQEAVRWQRLAALSAGFRSAPPATRLPFPITKTGPAPNFESISTED